MFETVIIVAKLIHVLARILERSRWWNFFPDYPHGKCAIDYVLVGCNQNTWNKDKDFVDFLSFLGKTSRTELNQPIISFCIHMNLSERLA